MKIWMKALQITVKFNNNNMEMIYVLKQKQSL